MPSRPVSDPPMSEELRRAMKAAKVAAKVARKKARRAERARAAIESAEGGSRQNDIAAAEAAAEAASQAAKTAQMEKAKADAMVAAAPLYFSCMSGKIDIAEGLVLHRNVISEDMERELIDWVLRECERGRQGLVRKPTYLRASGARSQGNEREALMYGGFFDFNRARPGKRGLVPPFPPILNRLVEKLVDEKGLLPKDVRPDSVIINSYSAGDCIPPHVDHPSYYRPISTLSLLGEEPMLIGSKFRTVKACTWEPTVGLSVSCPRRSLLVLGGNSGNIAKHCISCCKGPRISITLRKQPPPDWRPDKSELVSGTKKRKRSRDVQNHERKNAKKADEGQDTVHNLVKAIGRSKHTEITKDRHISKQQRNSSSMRQRQKNRKESRNSRRSSTVMFGL